MTDFNCDIRKLAEILKTEDGSSDSDDDLPGMSKIGPGDIGKSRRHSVGIHRPAAGDTLQTSKPTDPDAIWTADEVIDQPTGEECFDPREQPEYEIKYQQAVRPEDVFLQMNGKTASTASCENIIILIFLKGETKSAVDLTITSSALDIRSPLYRLHLHLPHPVDGEKGKAEWDDKTEILKVTLQMVREFDFLNF